MKLKQISKIYILFSLSKSTKINRNFEKKKIGVAILKLTRDDNSKGTRIGPSLFYTSKLYNKYLTTEVLISY